MRSLLLLLLFLIHLPSPSLVRADGQSEKRRAIRGYHSHTRCGGKGHAHRTRPCPNNDTYCGEWKGRFWQPLGCKYELISPEKAATCIGNRTIAFIGDSQIRDLCVGLVYYLLGIYTLDTAPDTKFDRHLDISDISDRIENFDFWKENVPPHNYNGNIFPQRNVSAQRGIQWQIQMWSLYTGKFFENGQIEDILTNRMAKLGRGLRPIDIAFINIGVHDWGWFFEGDIGSKYYKSILGRFWLNYRDEVPVPTVWTSMNPECIEKLSDTLSQDKKDIQVNMVEVANAYANERLLKENKPYFDYAAPLRTPERCEHSADGLHVKMYVNVMAGIMLLNHLCDSHGNWRGNPSVFM